MRRTAVACTIDAEPNSTAAASAAQKPSNTGQSSRSAAMASLDSSFSGSRGLIMVR
jgi:hypothetical protein